ncbi:hypothetical protein FHG66_09405 [Rubellimicrobium rubrum]|uniref:Uncharacterized protein n=1 Tax=Rubellimicrobium rubrum TaxID=2585369 RepID=A0A5C4N044_9RHOB|nr:hypothetical protein [Rubellimicrobium rubrum]TNC50163.1 hypothetical protein FHG66_09405 [Rubellimicrobium rubrum]
MADQPNPPDRDDAVTERAVSMDTRPVGSTAGAGRAINAAFSRRRPEGEPAPQVQTTGQQDTRIEGAGYPSEDRDDVDPEIETEDDDGYRDADNDLDNDDDAEDAEEADEDGYRTSDDTEAETLGANPDALQDVLVPPGGDALGGNRDTDPNLNGGHGIQMTAPEEGPVPIEDEPTDLSIIGHGHEDKAAWNRERVAHLQDLENDERDLRDATSEDAGVGGAVLGGVMQGWEGGDASPTIDQGDDPTFDSELSEEEEVLGDMAIDDMAEDVMEDGSIRDPNNMPFLPEHRAMPDDNLSLEEQLIATPGEDVLSSGAEIGVNEELEAEELNQTDSISRTYEDTREFLDDSMAGNERKGGVEND